MSVRAERGFVLIAVLWMLAALAALASAYSLFAVNTAASVYLPQERLRVDAALRSAVELTAYRQLSWPKATRPARGAFSTRVGNARIDVVYRAETARVDLNNTTRDYLAALFGLAGANAKTAGFLADRAVAWRTRLDDQAMRAETAIYSKAGLAYGPLGASFDTPLELALLPNMSPTLLARALPYFTVYSGSGQVNPAVADPLVLAAIPGMTANVQRALSAAVSANPPDPNALATIDGSAKDYLALEPNPSVRAQVLVTFPDRKVNAEIVLQVLEGAAEPYKILYWRDDFDDPARAW